MNHTAALHFHKTDNVQSENNWVLAKVILESYSSEVTYTPKHSAQCREICVPSTPGATLAQPRRCASGPTASLQAPIAHLLQKSCLRQPKSHPLPQLLIPATTATCVLC